MRSQTWFGFCCGVVTAVLYVSYQQDRHGGLKGYVAWLEHHWNEYPVWVAYVWLAMAVACTIGIALISWAEDYAAWRSK
jgi:hypothetical protein